MLSKHTRDGPKAIRGEAIQIYICKKSSHVCSKSNGKETGGGSKEEWTLQTKTDNLWQKNWQRRLLKQKTVCSLNNTYLESEKFFSSNPLDFESFSLTEEYQIAHLLLNGVPLIILDEERELEKLYTQAPPLLRRCPLHHGSLIWCRLLQELCQS